MKELSIEEKAKRYDEAIEIINDYYQKIRYSSLSCASNDIEVFEKAFPELKENEDERIIERIKKAVESYWSDEPLDEILAWLEKQGEQKPADKVEPKFRIGDIIKDTEDGEVFTIRTITKDKYIYTDDSFDWIKDQDDYELVEQKPAWSEEDEDILNTIINHFKVDIGCTDEDDIVRLLKFLKYKYTWKPSDEQIWCLSDAVKHYNSLGFPAPKLKELLDDLKKLKS